jgi:hypothetical protein
MALLATTRSGAQVTVAWQATTASMWASEPGCASQSNIANHAFASGETASSAVTLGDQRRVSVDVSGAVARGDRTCGGGWSTTGALRTTFGSRRLRFWVAYTASRATAPDTSVRQPGLSAGLERRIGRTTLAMSVGPRRDRTSTDRDVQLTRHLNPEQVWTLPGTSVRQETTYVADTVTRLGTRRAADLALALSWTRRALGIDAAAHVALATELRRADPLARVQLAYRLTPRVAATAGLVSGLAISSLDVPSRHVVTVGLRLSGGRGMRAAHAASPTAASDFRATTESDGQIAIAVRAARAERVEVAGDFTQWAPLSLQRSRDGWWRARTHITTGPHRLSIRVDAGRWTAPPGLPPVRDEFGETVGLLVVR